VVYRMLKSITRLANQKLVARTKKYVCSPTDGG
jgi:hypothetical protein